MESSNKNTILGNEFTDVRCPLTGYTAPMNTLNSRERLLRSLSCEVVDRVAVSPFIHRNFVAAYFGDPLADVVTGTVEVYDRFGFDLMHRNIQIRHDEADLDGPGWESRTTRSELGGSIDAVTEVSTPRGSLRQSVRFEQVSPYYAMRAITESFIKERQDFDTVAEFLPQVPLPDFTQLQRAKETVGNRGICAPWTWGLFNYVVEFRGLSELFLDAMEDEGFYRAMMSHFLARQKTFVDFVATEGCDALCYSGNIANGSMAGPDFYRKYVFEYESELIAHIRRGGIKLIYHNCGDGANMVEVYNELGIDAFETFSEPPIADFSASDAATRFSPKVALIGNIDQIGFLRSADPVAVKAKARELYGIFDGRPGYILGTSDFLEEDTPSANLDALSPTSG